jgi:hypothetical protein
LFATATQVFAVPSLRCFSPILWLRLWFLLGARAECLDAHWFTTLAKAKQLIELWRRE